MTPQGRILITGASGMVGRSLVRRLTDQGFKNLLTPSSQELNLLAQDAATKFLNVHQPKFIFHLAGRIGGIKANISRPVEFLFENTMINMNLIRAAYDCGIEKFLNVASSCIYPRQCPQPMHEEHLLSGKLEPTNEGYAISKIAGIKLCEYFNNQYKTNFISLIPCNLYGINDHFEPENSHVISALVYKMHLAKEANSPTVEIWGTGVSRREFLFVDDFSDAMIFFMKNWAAPKTMPYINIGLGEDITIRDLALLIKKTVGFNGELTFNASAPDGMPKKLLDVSRASELGWKAKTSLADGLQKTYQWYQKSILTNPTAGARP